MQDATQILNTLDNTRVTQRDYSDVQWQYVQDQNGGNYSNMIQFNTTILKPFLIDYHNAYVWLPMTIASQLGASSTYDGTEALAYRESTLQLINQLIVTTDTGMTLVNENMSPFYINWLRLIIENNTDYFKVNGGYLQMAETVDKWLDVQTPGVVNSFTGNTSRLVADWADGNHAVGTGAVMNDANKLLYGTTGTPGTTLPVVGENKFFNPAFLQRIGFFKNMNSYNSTNKTYNGIVMLPLALLHDFFRQLNMGIINLGFQFQFYLTQPQGILQNQQVFMSGAGVSSDTVDQPIIKYGNTSENGQGARLFVRNLKLNASDSMRLQAKLAENFTKSINFLTTDYIPDRSAIGTIVAPGASAFFQQEIVATVVYPLRIWMLCYPDAAISNTNAAMRLPLNTCPYYLDDANILINGVPYWKMPQKFPNDHWEMIKSQFPSDSGSILTYSDYLRFASIMCFDIQRLGLERISSPTEPVSLSVTGNLKSAPGNLYTGACKVVYLIERMNEITFSFGSTTTSLVVGNISLNNTA